MKKLIFLLLISISSNSFCQILIDRDTHEEIKKNIEDYKKLIIKYDSVVNEIDVIKSKKKGIVSKITQNSKKINDLRKEKEKIENELVAEITYTIVVNNSLKNKYDSIARKRYINVFKIKNVEGQKIKHILSGGVLGIISGIAIVYLLQQIFR